MTDWTPDNLWVVAENQMGGFEACDSHGGHLHTYETQEEAQSIAESIIEELNDADKEEGREPSYAPDSWAGVLLRDAEIGDNQEKILFPGLDARDGISITHEISRQFPRAAFELSKAEIRVHNRRGHTLPSKCDCNGRTYTLTATDYILCHECSAQYPRE